VFLVDVDPVHCVKADLSASTLDGPVSVFITDADVIEFLDEFIREVGFTASPCSFYEEWKEQGNYIQVSLVYDEEWD
jgi:hypothetical protein